VRIYGFLTLFTLALAAPAHAQESNITNLPSQSAPASAAAEGTGRFASPNGQLGAGLSFDPAQKGRAFVELAIMHQEQSQSVGGASLNAHLTSLTWVIGGAYKVLPNVELEAFLPMGWISFGETLTFPGQPDQSRSRGGTAIGNLHLGASYLLARDAWRLKVGGALEWGPWTSNLSTYPALALVEGNAARSGQDIGLWEPEEFSVVAPARFEYGDRLVGTGDAQLGLHFPTGGGDTDLSIQLAPGIGYYVTDMVLLGARLPFIWVPTSSGDNAQTAFEPYARLDFDNAFVNTRFTLNLDEPLGFGFDSGKVWAWHVGGGGTF
jgi:hypothetical protein